MVKALLVAMLFLAQSQDADTRALLRLEDDWARALVKRDTVVFQRLLASGFVYTENDKTMDRVIVLHEVGSGSDTVTAAHNEAMEVHRFGATALVTGWLAVQGRGPSGSFDRRYRLTANWAKRRGRGPLVGAL